MAERLTSLRSLLQKALCFAMIVFSLLLVSGAYYAAAKGQSIYVLFSDYGKFYESAQFAQHGLGLYTPIHIKEYPGLSITDDRSNNKFKNVEPHISHYAANLNPPFFQLLLSPISQFSYATSLFIWLGFSIACGIIAISLIIKIISAEKSKLAIPALTLALFAYYPTFVSFQFGQVTLFLLSLLVGGWWAAHNNRPILTGMLIGIAASIKLFLGLFFLFFLLRREWHSLFWFGFTILICAILPLSVFPLNDYISYHHILNNICWYTSSWNASLYGFILRVFGGHAEKNIPLWLLPHLGHYLYWIIYSCIFIAVVKLLQPNHKIPRATKCDLDFSVVLVSALILSPLGWLYYFPFLIIPFLTLFSIARSKHDSIALHLVICLVLIASSMPFALLIPVKINTAISIFLYSGIYFYVLVLLLILLGLAPRRLAITSQTQQPCTRSIPNYLVIFLYIVAFLPSASGVIIISGEFMTHMNRYLPKIEIIQPKLN